MRGSAEDSRHYLVSDYVQDKESRGLPEFYVTNPPSNTGIIVFSVFLCFLIISIVVLSIFIKLRIGIFRKYPIENMKDIPLFFKAVVNKQTSRLYLEQKQNRFRSDSWESTKNKKGLKSPSKMFRKSSSRRASNIKPSRPKLPVPPMFLSPPNESPKYSPPSQASRFPVCLDSPKKPIRPESPILPTRPKPPKIPIHSNTPSRPVQPEPPKFPVSPEPPRIPMPPEPPRIPKQPELPKIPIRPETPKFSIRPEPPKIPMRPEPPKIPLPPEPPNITRSSELPKVPARSDQPTVQNRTQVLLRTTSPISEQDPEGPSKPPRLPFKPPLTASPPQQFRLPPVSNLSRGPEKNPSSQYMYDHLMHGRRPDAENNVRIIVYCAHCV